MDVLYDGYDFERYLLLMPLVWNVVRRYTVHRIKKLPFMGVDTGTDTGTDTGVIDKTYGC